MKQRRHKLNIAQAAEIRESIRIRKSLRSKELARKYGVSVGLIQAIAVGRRTGQHG